MREFLRKLIRPRESTGLSIGPRTPSLGGLGNLEMAPPHQKPGTSTGMIRSRTKSPV
jgi:hypothetical protein